MRPSMRPSMRVSIEGCAECSWVYSTSTIYLILSSMEVAMGSAMQMSIESLMKML